MLTNKEIDAARKSWSESFANLTDGVFWKLLDDQAKEANALREQVRTLRENTRMLRQCHNAIIARIEKSGDAIINTMLMRIKRMSEEVIDATDPLTEEAQP